MPKASRMRLLALTRMLTLQTPKWMQMEKKSALKHTGKAGDDKKGNATISIKLDEANELNCVLRSGQGSTFSVRSILKKIGRRATNKEAVQSSMLSQCGKTRPCSRENRTIARNFSNEDPDIIAILTPLLVRICTNVGLSTVKKDRELQHGNLRKSIFEIRGMYQKNKDAFFKKKRHSPRQESAMKKER